MRIKASYAQCKNCDEKDAYSILDDIGKGICVGHVKIPKPNSIDQYSICFVNKGEVSRYGLSRSELQMVCAASNFLLLLEEVGRWNTVNVH